MEREPVLLLSPEVRSQPAVHDAMLDVIVSLMPALVAAVVVFGPASLYLTAATVASCVLGEFLCCRLMKRKNSVGDLSAAVTGILLAFNLPASVPVPVAAFGGVFAVAAAKQLFGGFGRNPVNPALAARIFLLAVFPAAATSWPEPYGYLSGGTSAGTAPLALLRQGVPAGRLPGWLDLFLGNQAGALGETCVFALLAGGVYLMARRVADPLVPACFLGSAALVSFCMGRSVAVDLLSGGTVLGAVFMAADPATCPTSAKGKAAYAAGCGAAAILIRASSGLAGDVSFAIVLMNLLAPLAASALHPAVPAGVGAD